jgi:hypothetical protein
VYEQLAIWGLKLFSPLIQAIRALRSLFPKRRPKLIFAEKSVSSWNAGEADGRRVLHLHALLAVTNDCQQDGLAVVRTQVRRGAFAFWHQMEDCYFCDIGDDRVSPISAGVVITPRTTAAMVVRHPFFDIVKLPRPRTRWLSFRITATDQFNRRHNKRLWARKISRM